MDLLIDDCRDFNVDVIARTPTAALKLLMLMCWETVYFDYDLNDPIDGYDLLDFAIQKELLYGVKIKIVTGSPNGRSDMMDLLSKNGFLNSNDDSDQYHIKTKES